MMLPSLLARKRRPVAALLLLMALAQGVAAAGSAEAIRQAIETDPRAVLTPTLVIAALALASALAVLGERFVGERLAQSYVIDTRRSLFEAVIAQGTAGRESRWLTPLVSDLAALRNWAARGPIRLVTATVAGAAASVWFVTAWPHQAVALAPMAAGFVIILLSSRRLSKVIAEQRAARGGLTRFLIRRVRAETQGTVSPLGHGRKGLEMRSTQLGNKAESRALVVGVMEAVAVAAGALAGLVLVIVVVREQAVDKSGLIAGLALIAFIATRLLEIARALHAHAGGKVAQRRVQRLLHDLLV